MIQGSVGKDGKNQREDVLLVQERLNKYIADRLKVDGLIGPKTISAITQFQSSFMKHPDGRVDPGGLTWTKLDSSFNESSENNVVSIHSGLLTDEIISELRKSEGSVNHMYLDSVGKVTVGIGQLLSCKDEALKLPFVMRDTGKLAAPDDIVKDYDRILAAEKNQLAYKYKGYTSCVLREEDIENLFQTRLRDEFLPALQERFPEFSNLPRDAKWALLDMAYNLGVNGLMTKFPKMIAAIGREDWNQAALESRRPQLGTSRNEVVKQWFLNCA